MPVTARAPAFQLPKLPFGLSKPATKPAAPEKEQPKPADGPSPQLSPLTERNCGMRAACTRLRPAGGVLLTSRAQSADRLNVLLISVDDMNNDLGCYGHPLVKSPHIDQLARRGVSSIGRIASTRFAIPSRVSMLSGLRPDTTQVLDLKTPPRSQLPDAVFLPQYFRQHGYHTAHVGKIFHTGDAFEDPPSWDVEVRETGKHPPEAAILRGEEVDRPDKHNMEWAAAARPTPRRPTGGGPPQCHDAQAAGRRQEAVLPGGGFSSSASTVCRAGELL